MEIQIRITSQSVTREKFWIVKPFVQNKKYIDKLWSGERHIYHKLVQLNQSKVFPNKF